MLELIALVILLILSALMSGSETAITSMGKLKCKEIIERSDDERKKYFQAWLDHPEYFLTTILVVNNLVNIAAASIGTLMVHEYLASFGLGDAAALIVAVSTGVMTLMLLIFGEITPKNYCKHHADRLAPLLIGPIYNLSVLMAPVNWMFLKINSWFVHRGDGYLLAHRITESEIKNLMQVGSREGLIAKSELKMLTRIFEFDDTLIREIMVPKVDMVMIDIESTLAEVLRKVSESGRTRIPAFDGTPDKIVGVLHVKDLIGVFKDGTEPFELRKVVRRAVFVPDSKKVNAMLREFQNSRTHIAIVVDEYGGVSGLVTVEDIIEEIVGEIRDEHDHKEVDKVGKESDGSYTVDAVISLDELNEQLGLRLKSSETDSLGGYIVEKTGSIPAPGTIVVADNARFTVLKSDEKHVDKVKLEILPRKDATPKKDPPRPGGA